MSELKRNGWIDEYNKDEIKITETGLDIIGDFEPMPTDPQELVEMWCSKFREGAAKMLRELLKSIDGMTKEELGEATGFTVSGGTFNNYLSELKRNGLIKVTGDHVKLSEDFFG